MLESLANLGEFLGGIAVLGSLVYVGFQLQATRKQIRANTLQQRVDSRTSVWLQILDAKALHSARDKFFEHELYRVDESFADIEELTLQERRALEQELLIELVYFQNLHYQLTSGLIEPEQCLPLYYMRCLSRAPQRRYWKDVIRLMNHYPRDFVSHVDNIVKQYDQVEKIMDQDQDASFESVVQSVFKVPAPPNWLD